MYVFCLFHSLHISENSLLPMAGYFKPHDRCSVLSVHTISATKLLKSLLLRLRFAACKQRGLKEGKAGDYGR